MAKNCDGHAVLSYSTILQVKDPDTAEFVDIGGVTDFNGPQTSRGEIDVTTLCSKAKEYLPDLKDNGTFTATMQVRFGDPAQQVLLENLDSQSLLEFKMTLPDDGYDNGPVTALFKASVTSFPVSGSQGQALTAALSLRISGDVTWTFPSAPNP